MGEPAKPAIRSDHTARFYENDTFLCNEVGRFLAYGLDGGEVVLVVATERHRRAIASTLEESGFDLDRARSTGQFLELDAEEVLSRFMQGSLRNGLPDEASFHRVVGVLVARLCADARFTGLRAFGEMVDLLVERGNATATVKLEDLWNDLGRRHSFRLLCGYSMRHFRSSEETEVFRKICDQHAHVLPAETYDDRWSDDEQHRMIAELQQRAGALEAEVAERRGLERALRDEQDRLRDANHRKDEFIALLSHELRNPLAPILTSLDLMDLRGDAASRREREIIRRQARHLATLVEDLLDVSRVASGKITLQKQTVEFATIADAAIEMTSPLFAERGHVLEVSVPGQGLLLEADPVRLPQVLANLLANAAKFTPTPGRVSLRARREGSEIVAVVEDYGVGIPRETIGEIFAPFTQARQSLDRANGGLGLGLTLVRSIAQLHGGSVSAESEGAGKGSRFILRFPAARDAVRRPPRRTVGGREGNPHAKNGHRTNGHGTNGHGSEHTANGTTAKGHGTNGHGRQGNGPPRRTAKVLIVDDNRDAAVALASLITELGFEVRTAHDGPEAIEIAREFGPDTALLDIGLPAMDGYTLGTRLRRLHDGAPLRLIALTGYGQVTDRARSLLAGFDQHVVKPVGLERLQSLLADIPEPRLS